MSNDVVENLKISFYVFYYIMTSIFLQSRNNIHEKIEGENGALQIKLSSNDGLDLFLD